ncbi:MAG: beta-galactosidase [Planctomycetota bacterium]
MRIGVAYYPEHWPEDRWAEDARLMRETGVDVVRIGEFAWSRLEPRRGQYDLDWLQRAIDVLSSAGLKVILSTPTATPPPWLFNRHPTMMPEDREGKRWYTGSRRHVCLNNRPYRRYVRRIVRELARNLGNNPNVIAWQIDNELGCHGSGHCYCDDCEQAFREWLKRRYGTIERLNKLWCGAFWSQEYADWHHIPAPRRTPAGVHPSLALDYERFTSATIRDFCDEQRELIEDYSGVSKPITTNGLGLGTEQVNQFALASVLDVTAYDNYPVDGEDPDGVALQLDLARSAGKGPFWVMEQQAGATMIPRGHAQPRPGQLRLWSLQAAARGADLISYFRWRTCPAGQEMHWYGIMDADGSRRRRYEELQSTMAVLKQKAHLWEGRLPHAQAAMVLDYDAVWALRADSMAADLDPLAQFRSLYAALRRRGVAVDIVPPGRDVSDYSVLVAPMPVIGRVKDARAWTDFATQGGVLLVTAPAGYRNQHNAYLMTPPPGPFSELLGVEVPEHDALGPDATNRVTLGDSGFAAGIFCSLIELQGAEAVGTYETDYYAGRPAVTRCPHGQGAAWFLGTVGEDALHEHLIGRVLYDAGVEPNPWASDVVEVIPLKTPSDDSSAACFVLNHSGGACQLELSNGETRRDLLTDQTHEGTVPLPGYGVALLQQE